MSVPKWGVGGKQQERRNKKSDRDSLCRDEGTEQRAVLELWRPFYILRVVHKGNEGREGEKDCRTICVQWNPEREKWPVLSMIFHPPTDHTSVQGGAPRVLGEGMKGPFTPRGRRNILTPQSEISGGPFSVALHLYIYGTHHKSALLGWLRVRQLVLHVWPHRLMLS